MASRYEEIVINHCPRLTEAQWCAICDIYNAHLFSIADGPNTILEELQEADVEDGLGAKWDVDIPQLCRELEKSGTAGRIAALEMAQRFWLTFRMNRDPTYADHLASIGAALKE